VLARDRFGLCPPTLPGAGRDSTLLTHALRPGDYHAMPSAQTAAMLLWALLASGQINMRKVDGWETFATKPIAQPIDLAA
jgi:hypothetical protein